VNKNISLIALGIALAGMLIYFLSSGTQPDNSSVVSVKPPSSGTVDQSVAAESVRVEESPSSRKPAEFTAGDTAASSDVTAASSDVTAARQQVPALEPETREALGKILNTSSEGLVEETHNGVTSVDLQGRFRTAPVATVDEDGNVQITDYSHLPKKPTQP
jgi:hypothetical protein